MIGGIVGIFAAATIARFSRLMDGSAWNPVCRFAIFGLGIASLIAANCDDKMSQVASFMLVGVGALVGQMVRWYVQT